MKFKPGKITISAPINKRMIDGHFDAFINKCLSCHLSGCWGDTSETVKENNNIVTTTGTGRILSAYKYTDSTQIWVVSDIHHAEEKNKTMVFTAE